MGLQQQQLRAFLSLLLKEAQQKMGGISLIGQRWSSHLIFINLAQSLLAIAVKRAKMEGLVVGLL